MRFPNSLPPARFLLLAALGVGCDAPEPQRVTGDIASLPTGVEREVVFPQPFSYLSGVRELSDRSLLAADPLGQVLLRIDLATGAADTLGRIGDGPQEYRQPDHVLSLPRDSTLLVDLAGGRLVIVDPGGVFRERVAMSRNLGVDGPGLFHPRFSDARGRLYMQAPRYRGLGPPDSAAVVRWDRESDVIDTVATVWIPEYRSGRGATGRGRPRSILEARDDWAVGGDGEVAVVRARDYSVEWHLPDGTVHRGPPHPFEAPSLTQEDKEALLEEGRSSGISMTMVSTPGGVVDTRMTRGITGGEGPRVEDFEWPEVFPTFRPERSLVSPEGEIWVERYTSMGSASRYEVFGPDGVRRGIVELPAGSQLIGFARGGVYLVRTDEVGLKWLERHRLHRE